MAIGHNHPMPAYPDRLSLPHGELTFPVYLPDATQGVVRAVDATDLEACRIQAVVMNTFHLMQRPGSSTIQSLGGLHRMSGWRGPIITDSGGFQAYSLIHQNPKYGTLSERGGFSAGLLREARITREMVLKAIEEGRGGQKASTPQAESRYRTLEKYARDLTAAAREGKLFEVLSKGGIVFYGGLIGGIFGAWLGCRLVELRFVAIMDFCAPALALAHGIADLERVFADY